jgi:hypothetical protein
MLAISRSLAVFLGVTQAARKFMPFMPLARVDKAQYAINMIASCA